MLECVEQICLKKERKKGKTRKLEVYKANIMHFSRKMVLFNSINRSRKQFNAHFAEYWYCSIASIDQEINSLNLRPQ